MGSGQMTQIKHNKKVLVDCFRNRNLCLSAPKSSVSLFTTWTKEVRKVLNVKVEGNIIPTIPYPRILGVTFDNRSKSEQEKEGRDL